MSEERNQRKSRVGVVVSNKMDKTVIIKVERRVLHPKYQKIVRKFKKLAAHDQENTCNIGDTVRVLETRPLSATKRWRVVEVLQKAQ
jgi:small subunit ribosomal protein S17